MVKTNTDRSFKNCDSSLKSRNTIRSRYIGEKSIPLSNDRRGLNHSLSRSPERRSMAEMNDRNIFLQQESRLPCNAERSVTKVDDVYEFLKPSTSTSTSFDITKNSRFHESIGTPSERTALCLKNRLLARNGSSHRNQSPERSPSRLKNRISARNGSPQRRQSFERSPSPLKNRLSMRNGSPQRNESPLRKKLIVTGNDLLFPARNTSTTQSFRSPPQDDELVCYYDKTATKLYNFLESSNWNMARSRCQSHPHEVCTWIVRLDDKTEASKIRWKLLPLHAALIFQCPTYVVTTLIDHYPGGVTMIDDQGMLPLHLAFRYKENKEDVIELLMGHCPKAVSVRDNRGRTPLDHGKESEFSGEFLRKYGEAVATTVETSSAIVVDNTNKNNAVLMSTRGKGNKHVDERINQVVSQYEDEINRIEAHSNQDLQELSNKQKLTVKEMHRFFEEEKKRMNAEHEIELDQMREKMSTEINEDNEMINSMQSEINQMNMQLEEAHVDRDSSSTFVNSEAKAYITELQEQIHSLLKDQEKLHLVLSTQQKEIDYSREKREHLLESMLLENDNTKQSSTKNQNEIIEIVDSLRTRMEESLLKMPNYDTLSPSSRNFETISTSGTSRVTFNDYVGVKHFRDYVDEY